MTYDEWVAAGVSARRMKDLMQWQLCDWLVFGEEHFGEEFAQAVSDAGISPGSASRYLQVGKNIPVEIRRADLTWAHHNHVAAHKYSNEERTIWLDKAATLKWGSEELAANLKDAPPIVPPEAEELLPDSHAEGGPA